MNPGVDYIFGKPHSDDWTPRLKRIAPVLNNYLRYEPPEQRLIILSTLEDLQRAELLRQHFPSTFGPSGEIVDTLEYGDILRHVMEKAVLEHLLPAEPTEFPMFCKRNHSSGGSGVFLVPNETDLKRIRAEDWPYGHYLQQPVLSVDEYVTHALIIKGQCRKLITFRYTLQDVLEIKRWPMPCKRDDSEDLSPLHAVFKALNYHGFASVNFKFDAQDQIKILEINPRMGASLVFNEPALREMMDCFSGMSTSEVLNE
jgi:hypothetical protein